MLGQVMKDNPVAQRYIEEIKPIRLQLEAFMNLSEAEYELTDEQRNHWQKSLARGEQIADMLDAIEAAIDPQAQTAQDSELMQSMDRAAAQHDLIPDVDMQALAGKRTLELLNLAARHLSGRGVAVVIQEPRPGAIGETFYEGDALKIAISPRAVYDGDNYLAVFLHEVAHAKLHMSADCDKPVWKMEEEAQQQAQYWTAYARKHYNPMQYVGEGSGPARQFRSKLITLLASQEAAETIGTY